MSERSTLSRRTLLKCSGMVVGSAALFSSLPDILTACDNTPSTTATASQPVKLRFSMLQDPGEIKNAKALGSAFSKLYPHVSFSYEPVAGTYDQKILTEAAGGTLADVFWIADVLVPEFASKGIMLELDTQFTQDKVNIGNIYPSMLGLAKYNGKLYAVPRDYNHVVTYYNQDAFSKAGLAAPSMNWTYTDFLTACEALVTKGGMKYALNLDIWWATYVPFVRGFGGDMLSSDGKSVLFTSPQALAGLQALTDLVAKGYAVNPANPPTNDPFEAGDAAMNWSVRPVDSSYQQSIGNKFAWNVTRFPKMPQKPVIGAGMSGYAVSAQSQHTQWAVKFLEYIISPAGQRIFEATGNSVPVLESLQTDSTWLSLPRPGFNNQAFFYDYQDDTLPPNVPASITTTYNNAINDAFTKVYLKKASVKDAFTAAANTINSALSSAS
jgi:multiple sugar transport system substrate-binding protein